MGLVLGSAITGASTAGNLLSNNPLASAGVSGALSSAQSFGTSYPVTTPLPDWLSKDTSSQIGELSDTYKTAPKSITDAAAEASQKGEASADMAYGQAMRQGANATLQATNVSRQQGGTGKTSSIIAGQMGEEAAKNKTDTKLALAKMKLDAQTQAASLSSQIAANLGNLRTSYLNTLANFTTTTRAQNMGQTDAALNYGADAAKTAAASDAAAAATAAAAPKPSGEYYTGMRGVGSGPYGGLTQQADPGQNVFFGYGATH